MRTKLSRDATNEDSFARAPEGAFSVTVEGKTDSVRLAIGGRYKEVIAYATFDFGEFEEVVGHMNEIQKAIQELCAARTAPEGN